MFMLVNMRMVVIVIMWVFVIAFHGEASRYVDVMVCRQSYLSASFFIVYVSHANRTTTLDRQPVSNFDGKFPPADITPVF